MVTICLLYVPERKDFKKSETLKKNLYTFLLFLAFHKMHISRKENNKHQGVGATAM